ncbi:unnamed protein product, partial [Mesorhabditis spiculigera]
MHLYPFHVIIIEPVIPQWGEDDEWGWTFWLCLLVELMGYGSFFAAALTAVLMLIPVRDSTTLGDNLRQELENLRRSNTLPTPLDFVPYVGEWLRDEWDNCETYDCDEKRGDYAAFVVGRVIAGFWTAFSVAYWYWRFGPRSFDDAYNFAEEFPRRLEKRVPDMVRLDWGMLLYTCGLYSITAVFSMRRPRNEHARPGKCCPRQPTKQMVVAWRYKWLKMTTQQ